MAEIRINATGGVKLYDADDSHYAQIIAGTITSNVDLLTLNSAGITVLDGAIDFDIASHDTSNGLKLGGTLVTATAAELNIMDGVTSTAAEINLIDGGTARGTTALADGDGILVNDGGTMRMTNVTTVKTYMGQTINNATANELVTVGSTTTELDAESGLTYTDGALVIGGTTPSLTIGDAGAEDTKIVFDGNAQDFYIGLDDSEDDLVIGLGSTVGTTAHVIIDETGAMTKPLQPAFFATKSGATANQTGDGTAYTFSAFTERYDQNADFNATTGTFTAPVTGRYLFQCLYALYTIDSDHTWVKLYINASNSSQYTASLGPYAMRGQSGDGYFYFPGCITHDMDAADTCTMVATVSGGSATIDPQPSSWFSGHLIC